MNSAPETQGAVRVAPAGDGAQGGWVALEGGDGATAAAVGRLDRDAHDARLVTLLTLANSLLVGYDLVLLALR